MKQLLLKGFLNSLSLSIFITMGVVFCMIYGQPIPAIAFCLSLMVVVTDTIDFYQKYKELES